MNISNIWTNISIKLPILTYMLTLVDLDYILGPTVFIAYIIMYYIIINTIKNVIKFNKQKMILNMKSNSILSLTI